jgi:hypothetical protein
MDSPFSSHIPINFIATNGNIRILTFLLNRNRFEEFRDLLGQVTEDALIDALEWTAKRGMIEEMKLVIDRLPMLNKWTIIPHLFGSDPKSIPILLNKLESLTAVDIIYLMTDFTVQPACLRELLRHPTYRSVLFEVKAPALIKPIAGFGFGDILVMKNERYALYESIIKEEKHRVIECMWRLLFWSVVLRTRIKEFQARYWGPEGKGYLKSKASFEFLQSK